tara:strand:- start:799 stop:999 length:201 start_codon:yes stop_codon:yes gene_type:complete
MKIGDLVTIAGSMERLGYPRCIGIVTCLDPEEIGSGMSEVEVQWTSGFTDCSNHSTWNLEIINGQD